MQFRPGTDRQIYPIETSWSQIANQPDITDHLPATAVVSLPVPGPTCQALSGFYYDLEESNRRVTVRLLARFCGHLPSCELLDVQFEDAFPELSITPIDWTPLELEPESEGYSELYYALQILLLRYHARELPGEATAAYLYWLEQLTPVCLHPVYYALNPHFFEWAATPEPL